MPLRMVKKDRDEQAKQQQALNKPAPGILGGSKGKKLGPGRAAQKAEEPKSPTERMYERKAQQRETRMTLKMKKGGLQKGIEGTTFKPKKQFLGVFGDSKQAQKKYYDMTSAAKRDAHKKGRVEGKKFRARTFVDLETGTLRLDSKRARSMYKDKVYKAPDVAYVEPRKYSKGGLKGNQKKLDKNNNNRIDAQDFKILKAEKKGKPMKAALGAIALGIGAKKMMDKNKMSMPAGMGAAALLAKKKKDILGKKRGGGIKKDPTKTVNPFEKKGSKFMERRKGLGRAGSMLRKAGRIGLLGAALGAAGAGAAKLGQTIGRKMSEKKNKKMGGGMMKKPGYKYGKMVEDKMLKYATSKETQLHSKDAMEGFDRAEKRSVSETMGEYKKDIKKYRDSKLKRLTRYSKGGGADTGKIGEIKSKLATTGNPFKRVRPKLKAPKRAPMKPLKTLGAMGGGMMMNKPMGYKSGTSVKAKCKLGRNKPTKMY